MRRLISRLVPRVATRRFWAMERTSRRPSERDAQAQLHPAHGVGAANDAEGRRGRARRHAVAGLPEVHHVEYVGAFGAEGQLRASELERTGDREIDRAVAWAV